VNVWRMCTKNGDLRWSSVCDRDMVVVHKVQAQSDEAVAQKDILFHRFCMDTTMQPSQNWVSKAEAVYCIVVVGFFAAQIFGVVFFCRDCICQANN